ncbi:hypothetical protein [Roseateles noduli]|uniref:hypothetical protein n=1 Tax=Roseateles noduli TaxID=2052484 RepID=UPI003D646ADC
MEHLSWRTWRRIVGVALAAGIASVAGIASAAPEADPAASAPRPALALAPVSPSASEAATSAERARQPLALQASLAALRSRLRATATGVPEGARSNVMLNRSFDIQVIELPREGAPIGPPPKRAHHALSIGMEGPKQMLRGLGLDATECAARFRMPSKLSRKGDGSAQIDVTAQLGMGCKF